MYMTTRRDWCLFISHRISQFREREREKLPRGVIDQSDLVLVVLNWC